MTGDTSSDRTPIVHEGDEIHISVNLERVYWLLKILLVLHVAEAALSMWAILS